MQIKNKNLGIVEIDEKDVIDFPVGIPGFPEDKKFVILQEKEPTSPFNWLVSTRDMGPSFVITDPRNIDPKYAPEVREAWIQELDLEKAEDALVYVILNIPEDIQEMTANLRAPVIINGRKSIGKQVVLEESEYLVKQPVVTAKKD